MLARSKPLSSRGSSMIPVDSRALLVLQDAKVARLFETDVMQNSGGLATVFRAGWGEERPGDVLLQVNGSKVKHAYVIVGHIHGFAVARGKVSYPSLSAPTRIAIRIERVGRGEQVTLGLGSLDGGIATTAANVKFYEIPATGLELHHLTMGYVMEVCAHPCAHPALFLHCLTYPLHTFSLSCLGTFSLLLFTLVPVSGASTSWT